MKFLEREMINEPIRQIMILFSNLFLSWTTKRVQLLETMSFIWKWSIAFINTENFIDWQDRETNQSESMMVTMVRTNDFDIVFFFFVVFFLFFFLMFLYLTKETTRANVSIDEHVLYVHVSFFFSWYTLISLVFLLDVCRLPLQLCRTLLNYTREEEDEEREKKTHWRRDTQKENTVAALRHDDILIYRIDDDEKQNKTKRK
jgi:hypothetical protein